MRCPKCDKPLKNERSLSGHSQHCYYNKRYHREQEQQFKGRKAEAAAKTEKLSEAQKRLPKIKCEGKALDNVLKFKYLGSIFAANGSQEFDIDRRAALATKRCGQLRNVFGSPDITLQTKLSIYKTAIMSLLTYGCEGWSMTKKNKAKINGVNSRLLSRFTGKTAHQEASARTRTYCILTAIRHRKLQWLGHILRLKGDRLVKTAIRVQFERGMLSNMLEDAPITETFAELTAIAADREVWKQWCAQRVGPKQNKRPTPPTKPTTTPSNPVQTNQTPAANANAEPAGARGSADAASAVAEAMRLEETAVNTNNDTRTTRPAPTQTNTTPTSNNNNNKNNSKPKRHRYNTRLRKRLESHQPPPATDPVAGIKAEIERKRRKRKKKKPKTTPWANERRQNWAREYYRERFGNNEPLQMNWSAMVAAANESSRATNRQTSTHETTKTIPTPGTEIQAPTPPAPKDDPKLKPHTTAATPPSTRARQMAKLRARGREKLKRRQPPQPQTHQQPQTQLQPQTQPQPQPKSLPPQPPQPPQTQTKTKMELLRLKSRRRFAKRNQRQQTQAKATPTLTDSPDSSIRAAATYGRSPREAAPPTDLTSTAAPNAQSLWAEAAPLDPSCMSFLDSPSNQSFRHRTPTHRHIMGHHTSTPHHKHCHQNSHTHTSPFQDITLSPIIHTQLSPHTHMYTQQSPTQHNQGPLTNTTHYSYNTTHSTHTLTRLNETYDHSTHTHTHLYETSTQSTLSNLHITHIHPYMNDTLEQNTSHDQNHSHTFTHMNDTYLIVHNNIQEHET